MSSAAEGKQEQMLVDEHGHERSATAVVADCRALTRVLRDRGVTPSDRVVLSAANSGDFVLTLLALMDLGVSVGLVDHRLPPEECAALVADSGARWFVSDAAGLGPAFDRVRVGWLELGALAEQARAGTAGAAGSDVQHEATGTTDTLAFERWAARDDGLVVWSSGSSGPPKGVVRSGASVLRNVERTQARMGYTSADVLLPLLAFTHQYGLSMLLLWWRAGATLTVAPSRRVDQALETIVERGVTVVDAVPATYDTLLRILERRGTPARTLASVRMWCVGGEPLRDQLRTRFLEVMGSPLLDGYGSSEAGNIALAPPGNPVHCGQPLDGVGLEVHDELGVPVPAGEIGEIVVRTPDFMTGVLEPGGRVRPVDRPVHHTQDVGYLTAAGEVCVLGRKFAVHRFGHTLYPDVLAGKAGACGAPVRVIPVQDDQRGTQLVFVVADPTGRPAAHWRRVIARFLADHERPNRVVVLPEFPMTNNGKHDLQALSHIATSAVDLDGQRDGAPADRIEPGADTVDLSAIPFVDRLDRLDEVAALLRSRRAEVLALLTEVSNYKTVDGEIDASIAALEGAAAEVAANRPAPVAQIGVLMPSNIPLYSYILYLVIPSLYSARVVFRPSRRIDDQTRKLHELLGSAHGLPIVLDDSAQREFLENEGAKSDVLVFTGSYQNAETIRTSLRRDQLFVYFGQGVNPFIVGADADISRAVDGLLRVRMLNSGQDCFGPDVVFVHTSVSAQFCNLLCRRVDKLRYGRLDDPTADYGPMFYLDAFDASLEFLCSNRDHVAAGGEVNFVEDHLSPTVLIRPADTSVVPPELFAPIFSVVPFTTQDWLHTTLQHPYFQERAMAATVFGTMPETVEMLRRRHLVSVNETLIEIEDGNTPFGGSGIRANYAAIGKKRHAEPLLLSKVVADHLGQVEAATADPESVYVGRSA